MLLFLVIVCIVVIVFFSSCLEQERSICRRGNGFVPIKESAMGGRCLSCIQMTALRYLLNIVHSRRVQSRIKVLQNLSFYGG